MLVQIRQQSPPYAQPEQGGPNRGMLYHNFNIVATSRACVHLAKALCSASSNWTGVLVLRVKNSKLDDCIVPRPFWLANTRPFCFIFWAWNIQMIVVSSMGNPVVLCVVSVGILCWPKVPVNFPSHTHSDDLCIDCPIPFQESSIFKSTLEHLIFPHIALNMSN